jgi:DNA-binding GntR family transcriptional regulator
VVDDLRGQIERGDLSPGERLPSGRDLANRYGVALMTVQKALTALGADGFVSSHTGRGTFVTAPSGSRPSTDLAALSQQLDELRDLVKATAERFDERLAALEAALALREDEQRTDA